MGGSWVVRARIARNGGAVKRYLGIANTHGLLNSNPLDFSDFSDHLRGVATEVSNVSRVSLK